MKLSKETVEHMLKREVKIVLPKLTLKNPPAKGLSKRKASKRGRISGCSDKENDNCCHVNLLTQPNSSLIQIEKAADKNLRDRHSKQLNLSEDDHNLLLATLNDKQKSTKYSKVNSFKIKSLTSRSNGIVSGSRSIKVSQSTTAVAGTSYSSNNVEINGTSSQKLQNKRTKRDKCYHKDSGIDVESPKKKKSTKRKFSEFSNDASDDIPETDHMDNEVPITNSSNEIRDFIQSYSSHKCTDKIDRKIENFETIRASNGLFIRNDFVIRIQQCCIKRSSEDSTPECSTSVVSIATTCENIKENKKKICRNVAVEKKVGISTRVKVGDEEKNCTRIVESKYIQTTKQSHKKIKLTEPSRMVTRHKAASNSDYEFFRLTHEKKCTFLVNPDIPKPRSDRFNQNKQNNAAITKKLSSHKRIVSKAKKLTKIHSQNNHHEEPTPSCSQSYHLSRKETVAISQELNTTVVSSKQKATSKVVKDVALYREECVEPSTSQVIKKTTNHTDKKVYKTKPKKTLDFDQNGNESSNTTELRKSSRSRKPRVKISYGSDFEDNDCSLTWKPKKTDVKKLKNSSLTEKISVSVQDDENQDAKSSAKLRDSKRIKSKKSDKVVLPKKSSLPTKRLMKKSEALEKTERFNEKKKNLRSSGKKTQQKTVSLTDSALPRRATRFSSKTQNNNSVATSSKTDVRATSCVTFSSKTPKAIPRQKNTKRDNWYSDCSPYVLLDKLDVNDVSTYAITPLREDRRPLPSKSYVDYGIDDVNTDDSTDDEDYPKKVVPQWVRSLDHKTKVQFFFPRETIKNWITPPTERLTYKSLFT